MAIKHLFSVFLHLCSYSLRLLYHIMYWSLSHVMSYQVIWRSWTFKQNCLRNPLHSLFCCGQYWLDQLNQSRQATLWKWLDWEWEKGWCHIYRSTSYTDWRWDWMRLNTASQIWVLWVEFRKLLWYYGAFLLYKKLVIPFFHLPYLVPSTFLNCQFHIQTRELLDRAVRQTKERSA